MILSGINDSREMRWPSRTSVTVPVQKRQIMTIKVKKNYAVIFAPQKMLQPHNCIFNPSKNSSTVPVPK